MLFSILIQGFVNDLQMVNTDFVYRAIQLSACYFIKKILSHPQNPLILDGQLVSNKRQNKHLFVLFRFKLFSRMYIMYDSYSTPYQLQYI